MCWSGVWRASRRSSLLSLVSEFWTSVTGVAQGQGMHNGAYSGYGLVVLKLLSTVRDVLLQRSWEWSYAHGPLFIQTSLFVDTLKVIDFIFKDVTQEDAKNPAVPVFQLMHLRVTIKTIMKISQMCYKKF